VVGFLRASTCKGCGSKVNTMLVQSMSLGGLPHAERCLMTEMHTVKIPESEDGLGIGQFIKNAAKKISTIA